ncbi:putative nuclear RNA binding protein [Aspergillus glaucus CBS 516.65]|uniref:Nuclear RNA binding protein n=1 Tax=Aspergillus glaucus CBS 516.65 TaxID=1160497 RepID=A0A1L9VAN7_ASPGL|nr:hypothetical protein ASPGLDRAFT_38605 [Aspergillus glaucus CBS 516.65]OJJ80997.1 hypothetical protein ASPGLDRAFT_38605 [Aspergillus glaucus CBS 516.65]
MVETPCLEVNLDLGPLHADHQLQEALHLNASRDDLATTSSAGRKHSRSSSNISGNSLDSNGSDVSGKFDDADELEYYNVDKEGVNGSPHSPKRRRSNDLPESRGQAHGQDKGREEVKKHHENASSFGRRWRNRMNGSPRVTATASNSNSAKSPKSPAPGGRRSRFVEGTMNDSVSEKPPSIYLREDLYAQEHQQYPQQQYFQHERGSGGASNHSHKSSGIFRFGKAIASAFNPFGGWAGAWKGDSSISGSGSGSGSASTDENYNYNQQQEDDITRVHRAYEELKKSGFKGTVKGAYMQDAQSSNALPEQAWKSIQEKMDTNYKPSTPGHHARQISGESQDSTIGGSIRTSLDLRSSLDFRGALDLRRAKSSLGISSLVKQQEPGTPEVRKQKSRKDLLKQAKLLKKVSNLEDKLERTRRELRELQGSQDKVPKIPKEYEQEQIQGQRREEQPQSEPPQQEEEPEQLQAQEPVPLSASEQAMSLEQPFCPKQFVPGTLSTLPSERTLENQAEAEDKKRSHATDTTETTAAGVTDAAGEPLQSLSPNITREANTTTTPKKETKEQSSLSATTDSSSLKRKSPDPKSLEVSKALDPNQDTNTTFEKGTPSTTTTPTKSNSTRRRSKFQKMGKSDSPGSVERRKSQSSTPGSITRRKPRYLNPTSPRSSSSARRRSRSISISTSASPRKAQARLKTKKGFYDLASASATALPLTDKDVGMDIDVDSDADTDIMDYDMDSAQQQQNHFYMQGAQQLDPNHSADSTPTPTPSRKYYDFEYIPPVPPLPKDLAATTAKVDQRLAKELVRRKSIGATAVHSSAQKSQMQAKQQVEVQVPMKDDFEWPEDIF